ncbi:MAG: kinase [Patescibacteria group bacterium]
MLITRTPLRISFFGGGTDYPAWYKEHGGMVLSTTIDKYSYITCRRLPPFFEYKYLIKYSTTEKVRSLGEIQHPSVRECLRFLKFRQGIEAAYSSDVPAMSGLGSSSAFTVGLLHALYALQGKTVTKRQLALDALRVEQTRIRESVGSQDQVAAAFGGFNKIVFGGREAFQVYPLAIAPKRRRALQESLMLFFTGVSRTASDIAKAQIAAIQRKETNLAELARIAEEAERLLTHPSVSLDSFGRLLHESWRIKRSVTDKITTPFIDDMYETARRAGAVGGKLLGAGGGGFMLFFVPKGKQAKVRKALSKLLLVPFSFDATGSQLIYYAPAFEA